MFFSTIGASSAKQLSVDLYGLSLNRRFPSSQPLTQVLEIQMVVAWMRMVGSFFEASSAGWRRYGERPYSASATACR